MPDDSQDQAKEKAISKAEVAYSLYAQAEQQLIAAIQSNDAALQKAQEQTQQAQANKIALSAQLTLIRKVNDKVAEVTTQTIFQPKESSTPTPDAIS